MNLCLKNLSVKAKDQLIIKDLSFSVKDGESVAIFGPSGSGKTTLVKTIIGLKGNYEVRGSISYDASMHIHSSHFRRRHFGYIPQTLGLWPHLTVRNTIKLAVSFAQPHLTRQQKNHLQDELLELCGVRPQAHRLACSLSGGEKQRLALARTLSAHPRMLLLDEPFSALDVVAKTQLIQLINDFQKRYKFSALVISHDLAEVMALSDKILILQNGEKLWFGAKDKIITAPFNSDWNPLKSPLTEPLFRNLNAVDYREYQHEPYHPC
jgi:ABC-type multidrug transport system ATPase subunit